MIQDLCVYRLPLVTRILVSGWLPVTAGCLNFGLRVITIGYRPYIHPSVTGYHRLQPCLISTGYQRLPIIQNFSGNRPVTMVTG